jgi:UDPglucose 6-dehydrogenase
VNVSSSATATILFLLQCTTIRNFYNPEFILFDAHDNKAAKVVEAFYKTITNAPFFVTTIENAEMIKPTKKKFVKICV